MDWVTIESPTTLCFYDVEEGITDNTYSFFRVLDTLPVDKYVKLDLSKLENITAAAALYLFAHVISRQLYISNGFYTVLMPKDKDVKHLFEQSGLAPALKKGGSSKVKNLWSSNSSFLCGNNSDVSQFMKIIRKLTGHDELPQNLGKALRETFLNINHHAYTINPKDVEVTWFCYFYKGEDHNGRYLAALISDRGAGIPFTIKNSFAQFWGRKDCMCIEYAMLAGVTSTQEDGRGQGSKNIQKPVELAGIGEEDSLLILSGKGYFYLTKEKKELTVNLMEMKSPLRGSILEWRLYY